MTGDQLTHGLLWLVIFLVGIVEAMIVWNWNKLSDQVDKKADKTAIDQLRTDMVNRWREQDERAKEDREVRERQDEANRSRLDELLRRSGGIPRSTS